MKYLFTIIISVCLTNSCFTKNNEKDEQLTRILFVLDGSQSMLTKWESGTKMQVAQHLLSEMVDSLKEIKNVEMALRVYGHQSPVPPQDCNDTKLEVAFLKNNAEKIKQYLYRIRPKGTTPIAYSLELAAKDFPKNEESRNIIILITDGIESCDGDPCSVSNQLQKKGIILKPFVIGIGLDDEFRKTFECVGRFYDANNEERFKEVLDVVISQALNTTTLQVNLLDEKNKATETNVNMTFYDEFSHQIKYNFIHTLTRSKTPDTLRIDPIPTYKIKVHTIPPTELDNVQLNAGQHNKIEIKTPQGSLIIMAHNEYYKKHLQFIVRDKKNKNTLNVQNVNENCKYIIGTYNLEVLTLPRMIFKDLDIKQSKTTRLEIPPPGLVTFTASANAVGAIYKQQGNELIWVTNLNSATFSQMFVMLPGVYQVIARPINAIESIFTTQKTFQIKANEAQKIVLF